MNEEISRRLREAAEAHQPDRGRMLARMAHGMAGTTVRRRTPGIARSWPKVAVAGVAAAGVLATASLAISGIVQTAPARPDVTITPTVPSPSASPASPQPTGSASPSAAKRTQPAAGRPAPGSPDSTSPPGGLASDGPLSSDGAVDPHSTLYWAQSALTLTTAKPLTALTAELRIAQTGGVQSTGQWQTGPTDDFTITVQEIDGAVVYRWELKPGRTVPAAQQIFAAQYNHAEGARHTDGDSYRVQATAADGTHTVRGGFRPPK